MDRVVGALPPESFLADLGKGSDTSSWARRCLLSMCMPAPETATRAAFRPVCCGESGWSNQFLGWWVSCQ